MFIRGGGIVLNWLYYPSVSSVGAKNEWSCTFTPLHAFRGSIGAYLLLWNKGGRSLH